MKGGKNPKTAVGSGSGLRHATVWMGTREEAGQNVTGRTFPGVVHTARDTTRVGGTRRGGGNPEGREVTKAGLVTGVKS